MSLDPTLRKDSTGVWYLDWTPDPAAIAYDIVTPAGTHVQAGKGAKSAKLGALAEPFTLPKIAPAEPGAYETPPTPWPPPAPLSVMQSINDGATLTGKLTWTAVPSSPGKVDFLIDGAGKWTEQTAPYQFNGDPSGVLDTTTLADGAHTFAVKVTAPDGRTATVSASATVTNQATPPTGSKQFGFSLSPPMGNWNNLTAATSLRQLQEAQALGMTCPRISGHTFAAQQCRDLGFKQWIVILAAGKNFADVTNTINYCNAWPEAIIEPGNELNIGGSPWTPEALADKHITWYKAVKASGVKNLLSMASVGNSMSTQGNLTPLDFNKKVAARGCVLGNGFDLGNYHSYGADPDAYDQWMHIYTPDASGASLQSIFHNPPYYITEFNLHTADANAKAAAIKKYMDRIKTLDKCLGGQVYTILNTTDAGTNWGLVTDSYVKIQPPWDTFKAGTA